MMCLLQDLKEYTEIHDIIVDVETGIQDLINGFSGRRYGHRLT